MALERRRGVRKGKWYWREEEEWGQDIGIGKDRKNEEGSGNREERKRKRKEVVLDKEGKVVLERVGRVSEGKWY